MLRLIPVWKWVCHLNLLCNSLLICKTMINYYYAYPIDNGKKLYKYRLTCSSCKHWVVPRWTSDQLVCFWTDLVRLNGVDILLFFWGDTSAINLACNSEQLIMYRLSLQSISSFSLRRCAQCTAFSGVTVESLTVLIL